MNCSSQKCVLCLAWLLLIPCCLKARLADPTALVPTNAVWRYYDYGDDLAVDQWRSLNYVENFRWKSGLAPLGFGSTPEGQPVTTIVNYGPDPANKYVTTYFRYRFVVTNVLSISNLTLTLQSLNGGVVYLNFFEIHRSLLPSGPIAYSTLALPAPPSEPGESPYLTRTIDRNLLNEGTNILAVEMHLDSPFATNLSFALKLAARYGEPLPLFPSVKRGPYLQTGTPNSMTVRWRTDLATESQVRYGTNLNDLALSSSDDEVTTEHITTLSGLSPNTKYYYTVGANWTNFAGGPDYFFVTSPSSPKRTRIWVIGDSGTANLPGGNSAGVRDAYKAFAGGRLTDVWLMLGDNAYYEGTDEQYQEAVFNTYPELLRRTVVWSTVGNHETYDPAPDGRIAYTDIFTLPTRGEAGGVASGSELYYSFNYGSIHFVCLDSEISSRSTNGPMLAWLQQDLIANTNEWLIAFWHSPPYSHGSHNSDEPEEFNLIEMRQSVLPILESFGVDLVLCGHSHCYERSFLLDGHYGFSHTLSPSMIKDAGSGRESDTGAYRKSDSTLSPHQGAVYVVNGASGWATFGSMDHPAMFKSLLRTGSLVIDVDANRLDAKFLRETGEIDDSFTLLKGAPPEPLRVTSFQIVTNTICATWKSLPGKLYLLQKAESFPLGPWMDVGSNVLATGATTSSICPGPSGEAASFYRVIQLGN